MKNKNNLKMVIGMAVFAAVLCLVGFLLRIKLDDLFRQYVARQVSLQAATSAELVNEKIAIQLNSLAGISAEIERDGSRLKDILLANTNGAEDVAYGVLALDGTLVGGDSLLKVSSRDFSGITMSFRGNRAVSYSKGKGFLLSVPIYRNRNVRYVLYKFYSDSETLKLFDVKCYGGDGYSTIRDESDNIIVGSLNKELSENVVWSDGRFSKIRSELKDLLNISVAASVREKIEGEYYYFFMADLKQPGLSLVGMVPEGVAANGIDNITFLIFWVFGMLLFLFLVGFVFMVISERKAEENDNLRRAKAIAENASVAKSQFLANMSHEIRTPINGILGMDTMLLKECKDPVLKEYAQNIQSAGHTLLSLINDVLDISKIESGKMEIVPVEYSLFSVLNDCYNMVVMRARDKSLDFKIKVDSALPSVLIGDEVRVRQIINNLLSNAVKYTPKGSVVFDMHYERIFNGNGRALSDANMINLIISVKDTGIGIREEDREKLFMSFQRLEEKRNRNIEGTGLGLNLTKRLVDLMNGEIHVDSEYGKGSTFTVIIPQIVKKDEPIGDFEERYHDYATAAEVVRNKFVAPNAHILVVDDVPMNLRVINGLLKETEVSIDTANNGMEALEHIKRNRYDVIFLDHMMPIMDGMETLSIMNSLADHPNKNTPVVMLTANAIVGAKDSYVKAGFTDYLTKPVREDALLAMLLKYLPSSLVTMVKATQEQESQDNTQPSYQSTDLHKPLVKEAAQQDAVVEAEAVAAPVSGAPEDGLSGLKSIEALDVSVGLGYCMNDEDFYKEMLAEYASSRKDAELNEAIIDHDFEKYRISVHALKSTSLTIGAVALSSRAKTLEFACKDGDYDFVREHHEELVREYRAFIKELEKVL